MLKSKKPPFAWSRTPRLNSRLKAQRTRPIAFLELARPPMPLIPAGWKSTGLVLPKGSHRLHHEVSCLYGRHVGANTTSCVSHRIHCFELKIPFELIANCWTVFLRTAKLVVSDAKHVVRLHFEQCCACLHRRNSTDGQQNRSSSWSFRGSSNDLKQVVLDDDMP